QTYALVGPGWTGTLPDGVIPITYPYNESILIFRVDRYSPSGEDESSEADAFRRALLLTPLSDYLADPSSGTTLIVAEAILAESFKTTADALIAKDPIAFLTQLQTAVASSITPPLSESQQQLSDHFDTLF